MLPTEAAADFPVVFCSQTCKAAAEKEWWAVWRRSALADGLLPACREAGEKFPLMAARLACMVLQKGISDGHHHHHHDHHTCGHDDDHSNCDHPSHDHHQYHAIDGTAAMKKEEEEAGIPRGVATKASEASFSISSIIISIKYTYDPSVLLSIRAHGSP
jgi:hypothetical protein